MNEEKREDARIKTAFVEHNGNQRREFLKRVMITGTGAVTFVKSTGVSAGAANSTACSAIAVAG